MKLMLKEAIKQEQKKKNEKSSFWFQLTCLEFCNQKIPNFCTHVNSYVLHYFFFFFWPISGWKRPYLFMLELLKVFIQLCMSPGRMWTSQSQRQSLQVFCDPIVPIWFLTENLLEEVLNQSIYFPFVFSSRICYLWGWETDWEKC